MNMNKREIRPGNGWRYIAGQVWEHTSGARVLVGVGLRLPCGRHLWVGYREVDRLIRINGGNRKRGLMALARIMTMQPERWQ